MRALVAALAVQVACVDTVPSEGQVSSSVVIDNRLSANRLSANRLSANRLSANRLSANRLSANRLELDVRSAEGLLATPEGREVLSFLISCAMPEDQTLVASYGGETFEFFGELGLAPRWAHHPLDRKGRRWVSACLFARVNANNVTVPVSLRGPHAQLTASDDEREGWPLEEGAFFGDYFVPEDEPIQWFACRGRDQAAGEVGGLVERDCAEPDPDHPGLTRCGFFFAGDCGALAPDTDAACKDFDEDGTYYERCAASAGHGHGHGHGRHLHHGRGHGHDRHAPFHEVITTFVMP